MDIYRERSGMDTFVLGSFFAIFLLKSKMCVFKDVKLSIFKSRKHKRNVISRIN